MDFDFEERNEAKLKNQINYLLTQLKFRNKKDWKKLTEEVEEAEHSELLSILKKVKESLSA